MQRFMRFLNFWKEKLVKYKLEYHLGNELY